MASLEPAASKRPHQLISHGDTRIDPWFWLRDVNDPETLEYLRAENAYTDEVMAPEAELKESLFQEMRGRIKEDDSTVPEKEGEYFYYARYEEGNEYPIFCRKHLSLDAPEAILLNVNELAKDLDYCRVGTCENSPDHKWLAYSVDTDGSEKYTIFFKNLETGELSEENIPVPITPSNGPTTAKPYSTMCSTRITGQSRYSSIGSEITLPQMGCCTRKWTSVSLSTWANLPASGSCTWSPPVTTWRNGISWKRLIREVNLR